MTRAGKVTIVVLVVIAALFAAAIVAGGGRGEGSAGDEDNGFVGRLADLAGDPAAVAPDDIATGCRSDADPTLLVFSGGCDIDVRGQEGLRVLQLSTEQALTVEAPSPEGDADIEADVDPGDEIAVAVGEEDTTVELSCGAGIAAECRVRIGPEPETG